MIVEIKKRLRTVGFRFDAMAAFLMCQHHGVDLDSLDNIPKDQYTITWVWSAHRSYMILKVKKPLSYQAMTKFIEGMKKSEWDKIIAAMTETSNKTEGDKKKVQPGMNSSSQDGKQD